MEVGGGEGGLAVFLLIGSAKIVQFRCPGCNLTVQGEAFAVQVWADTHSFDCFEERAKVHVLDEARADPGGGGMRTTSKLRGRVAGHPPGRRPGGAGDDLSRSLARSNGGSNPPPATNHQEKSWKRARAGLSEV